MRKDKVDIRRYRNVYADIVSISGDMTHVEFSESAKRRVTLEMEDWEVRLLVRKLAALPKKRAEELEWLRKGFTDAATEATGGKV